MIRVLIVAPYASSRAGLHALLRDSGSEAGVAVVAVVGEVSGSAEMERLLPELQVDVVVIDHAGPDGDLAIGIAASHNSSAVILSEEPGFRTPQESALIGCAYLSKDSGSVELIAAAKAAASGLIVFDHITAPHENSNHVRANSAIRNPQSAIESLTQREREVLQLMAQGLPNKNIAARLGISLHTVKFHVASILAKLNAGSRTEAVTLGARQGLVLL